MHTIQFISIILSSIVSLGAIVTMVYTVSKFIAKPHDTLEQRVSLLESQQRELERDKAKLYERCKEQDETNEVLLHSVLALVEFEMQYCIEEKKPVSKGLEKAKDALHDYLSKK